MNRLENPSPATLRRSLQISLRTVLLYFALLSLLFAVVKREGFHPAVWAPCLTLGLFGALVGLLFRGLRRRVLLRVLGIVFVGLYTCFLVLPPWLHYHIFTDEPSLNHVLSKQVQRGDSIEHVQTLLGRGERPSGKDRDQLLKATQNFAGRWPDQYPDRVKLDDVFLGYNVRGNVTYLQFRNGKLTNFNPNDFKQPSQISVIGQ